MSSFALLQVHTVYIYTCYGAESCFISYGSGFREISGAAIEFGVVEEANYNEGSCRGEKDSRLYITRAWV